MQPIKKMRNQNKKSIPIFFSLSIWEAPEIENRELKRDNFLFCLFYFLLFCWLVVKVPRAISNQPTLRSNRREKQLSFLLLKYSSIRRSDKSTLSRWKPTSPWINYVRCAQSRWRSTYLCFNQRQGHITPAMSFRRKIFYGFWRQWQTYESSLLS